MSVTTDGITSIVVNGVSTEVIDRGSGRPILFLHPNIGIDPAAPVLAALAKGGRVIAPSHPGFGATQLPKGITSVDDVSYFYLDLIEQMNLQDALVIGVGIGGWLACEIAVKTSSRFSHLVMGNPVGVKVGDRETRDIVDIWSLMPNEFNELAYHDPKAGEIDYKNLPEADSLAAARNREATARFGWSPYMHNPKLRDRLHRIGVPALVISGELDLVCPPRTGEALADAIPGAVHVLMEGHAHQPFQEAPDAWNAIVERFWARA